MRAVYGPVGVSTRAIYKIREYDHVDEVNATVSTCVTISIWFLYTRAFGSVIAFEKVDFELKVTFLILLR